MLKLNSSYNTLMCEAQWSDNCTGGVCLDPKTNPPSDFMFSIINFLNTAKLKAELKTTWLSKLLLGKFSNIVILFKKVSVKIKMKEFKHTAKLFHRYI